MAKGLLLVAFDYTNAHEDEFHDWYDTEHVPERERLPGFGTSERWISVANSRARPTRTEWSGSVQCLLYYVPHERTLSVGHPQPGLPRQSVGAWRHYDLPCWSQRQ